MFGHAGKAAAIDHVWRHRGVLFAAYIIADNKLACCEALPFVGPVTKHHLVKNLGVNTVKPDVHLARSPNGADHAVGAAPPPRQQTGYREATIDTILWRACADRLLDSVIDLGDGRKAAFKPPPATLPRLEPEAVDPAAAPERELRRSPVR